MRERVLAVFQSPGPSATLSLLQFDYLSSEVTGLAEASSDHCCPDKALGGFRKGESSLLALINGLKLNVASLSSGWARVVPRGPHSAKVLRGPFVQTPCAGAQARQQGARQAQSFTEGTGTLRCTQNGQQVPLTVTHLWNS